MEKLVRSGPGFEEVLVTSHTCTCSYGNGRGYSSLLASITPSSPTPHSFPPLTPHSSLLPSFPPSLHTIPWDSSRPRVLHISPSHHFISATPSFTSTSTLGFPAYSLASRPSSIRSPSHGHPSTSTGPAVSGYEISELVQHVLICVVLASAYPQSQSVDACLLSKTNIEDSFTSHYGLLRITISPVQLQLQRELCDSNTQV